MLIISTSGDNDAFNSCQAVTSLLEAWSQTRVLMLENK